MSSALAVAHARSTDAHTIAAELVEQLGPEAPQVVLFFAGSDLDFAAVAAAIARAFPSCLTLGCTTCGEIGPQGCTVGKVSAIALAAPTRARAVLLQDLGELKFDRLVGTVNELVAAIGETPTTVRARAEEFVFINLTDGLSGAEEMLLAAIASAAPGVPLVGGSAADDFKFEATQVAVGEQVCTGGAAMLLLEPRRPFEPFHLHHYTRGGEAIVVTEADPTRRLVSRLNGHPAVPYLAKVVGVDEQALRDDPTATLAAEPVVFGFEAGPATFMRSVMNVQGDALLMGGSLEEGSLIYPMRGGDIVASTRDGLTRALASVAEPEGVLLFNCGGRMWEATTRELTTELAAAMLPIPGAGFTTYGEQFGAVQINHTLTGLVFGRVHD